MDQAFHESIKPFCPCKGDHHHVQNLLEHLWFYRNIMSKNEEPTSGRSREETYESIKREDESWPSNLVRAPSLPPGVDRGVRNPSEKGVLDDDNNNLGSKSSMPAISQKTDDEIIQDEESDFSMGKLIRQASLSNSESFPPRKSRAANKGLTPSASISRHGSITKMDLSKLKAPQKTRPQRPMSQLKTQKSMNDLELYKELQGFTDLGLDSNEPRTPPVARKSKEDIKAQIKFWARAVASNVRQES